MKPRSKEEARASAKKYYWKNKEKVLARQKVYNDKLLSTKRQECPELFEVKVKPTKIIEKRVSKEEQKKRKSIYSQKYYEKNKERLNKHNNESQKDQQVRRVLNIIKSQVNIMDKFKKK